MNTNTEIINIYKKTSLYRSNKGCLFPLHALEPIGIEIISATSFNITILGDSIIGHLQLFIHDTGNVRRIKDIKVNTKTLVETSTLGEIFFYVDTIQYSVNNDVPFKFKITLELDSTSYVVNPIFDIREKKISNHNMEQIEFQNKVIDLSNAEYGMLMISDNVRIYMPKSKYIPKSFDARGVLELIEDTYRIYNKLNGLDNDISNVTPRPEFLLASARYEHVGYGSASQTMMDTGPHSAHFYMGPHWGLYHECGHMFEGWWSVVEVWTNMYSKFMEDRILTFTWLWGHGRLSFEDKYIKPLYEDYLVENKNIAHGTSLYFFISLEQALGANFVPKTELYSKLNSIPTSGYKYIIYSIAKNFGLNAIPYGEIHGQYIYEKSLINEIIDSSTATLAYVPENSSFNKYRNISSPVTTKLFYEDNPIIEGMSNPNAIININVKNNDYKINTNKNGKFSFKIPIIINVKDAISITSTEFGKVKSPNKTIYAVNHLIDSVITFYGLGDIKIASITFNVNEDKLLVSSTGVHSHSYFGDNEYFGVSLQDDNENIKIDSSVIGHANANEFRKTLNNQEFSYGDVLIVRAAEPTRVNVSNYNNQENSYLLKKNVEGFRIEYHGLYPQFEYSINEIIFRGLGHYIIAHIRFNITKKILEVSSTGIQSHIYFGEQEYFSVEILDENKISIVRAEVKGNQNANVFRDTLNNKHFADNYSLVLNYKENARVAITNYNNKEAYIPSGNSESFIANSLGLI